MTNLERSLFSVQIISTNNLVRSNNLVEKLTDQNIPFELTPGIVLTNTEFESGSNHSKLISHLICQRRITKAEVGCALAHQLAQKKFLFSDADFGIIFEDDAEIIEEFDLEIVKNYLNCLKPRILIFGWIPGYSISYPQNLQNYSNVVKVVVPPTCAFAYALNKSAARILASSEKILDLADWPIYSFNKVEYAIVASPWVQASQDPSLSLIGIREAPNSVTVISNLSRKAKLIGSVFGVFFIARFQKIQISPLQIFNRMVLKDFYYKFGVKTLKSGGKSDSNHGIVSLSKFSVRILQFFRLDRLS